MKAGILILALLVTVALGWFPVDPFDKTLAQFVLLSIGYLCFKHRKRNPKDDGSVDPDEEWEKYQRGQRWLREQSWYKPPQAGQRVQRQFTPPRQPEVHYDPPVKPRGT